ncbi:EAL domain-containing response regulator [Elioraea sp.]|uniref:EAL domain-containing response regulator n=1 Tax=Elioraea sp. TaxID=2185103 RepID=UPI00307E7429
MPRGTAGPESEAAMRGGAGLRAAIVVDDEPDIRLLVASQLRRLGVPAQGIGSKAELIAALEGEHPDLLLLDLSLGDSDAVEIFDLLAERGFAGRVVLMSGHAGPLLEHARRIGRRSGVEIAGLLRKPFRRGEIQRLVAGLGPAVPAAQPRASAPAEPGLLREAIAEGWLAFWYQPKVELASGAAAGMEALCRVIHPQRGVIGPDVFLPPADDGDLYDLTLAAARAALDAAARMGGTIPVSINLAGRTLLRPGLIEALKSRGEGTERRLMLEITETDLIGDLAAAEAFAMRAVLHGFDIAIDDFGSGYATFERLRHFPFAELKIERSIVHGCAQDEALRRICRAAVELGHGFEAKVVAEGIETEEDLAAVRELGFDLAQGYLFARPMPLAEAIAFLASGPRRLPRPGG